MMNAHRRASLICLFNAFSFFEGTRTAPCPAADLGRCPRVDTWAEGARRAGQAERSRWPWPFCWGIRGRFH